MNLMTFITFVNVCNEVPVTFVFNSGTRFRSDKICLSYNKENIIIH